jgi:hypothetical protein
LDYLAHDLVSQNQRQLWLREVSIEHVQVCPADRTGGGSDEYLTRGGTWFINLGQLERRALTAKQHGFHGSNHRQI